MRIVGIDIGMINLGVVRVAVDDDFNFEFDTAFRCDITHIKHNTVKPCDCCIPHTNETVDRVSHFVQEHQELLDSADVILIERQPPMGFKCIESLLTFMFRDRVKLISPNRMHKHFTINHLDYEGRKEAVVEVAGPHLGHLPGFTNQVRQHDMADACCICLFEIVKLKDERIKKIRLENIKRLPFDEYALHLPKRVL